MHLETSTLLFRSKCGRPLAFLCSKPLVAFLVFPLKVKVCWWSRPKQNHKPVLEEIALREGLVSIRFAELM
jgi:hypothetical protein